MFIWTFIMFRIIFTKIILALSSSVKIDWSLLIDLLTERLYFRERWTYPYRGRFRSLASTIPPPTSRCRGVGRPPACWGSHPDSLACPGIHIGSQVYWGSRPTLPPRHQDHQAFLHLQGKRKRYNWIFSLNYLSS